MRHLSKQRCWRGATDAVGRRWIRGPSWTHRVFGCEFQPTPSGKSRGGLNLPAGAVQCRPKIVKTRGLVPEVLHSPLLSTDTKPA